MASMPTTTTRTTGTGNTTGPGPPPPASAGTKITVPDKPKKKERWLVTRKTWRYMADAGKLLIPESLRKGKNIHQYSDDDLNNLEQHYQDVCDQQQDFIEWEGPRQDPRTLLAGNRDRRQGSGFPSAPETSGPKFRLVLPVGQQPPPGYIQVGRRTLPMGEIPLDELEPGSHSAVSIGGGSTTSGSHRSTHHESSYVQLPSGLVLQELPAVYLTERDWYARRSSSPPDSGVLSPQSESYFYEDPDTHYSCLRHNTNMTESGIGSGSDSVSAKPEREGKYKNMGIQTEPVPEEFFLLREEEKRKEEEERKRKEEEERLAREAEEKELEAMMGDSVMRYMKMVRRNSKQQDQKKAERFRSMNYDPTLRNIKAKYLNKEEDVPGFKKSMEVQVGESLLELLKKCKTPILPPPDLPDLRKFSSDMSDTLSPDRRLSVVDVTTTSKSGNGSGTAEALLSAMNVIDGSGGGNNGSATNSNNNSAALPSNNSATTADNNNGVERDFFAHLYSGDMTALESGAVPEDYYNYLESWYCAQKGLVSPASASSTKSAIATSGVGSGPGGGTTTHHSTIVASQPSIYIPVDALQNLRASMPTLVTCAAASSTSSVSRSTNSLGKSPGQSFLSSVISLRPFATQSSTGSSSLGVPQSGGGGSSSMGGGAHGARMKAKNLWRTRSKSRGRSSVIVDPPWKQQGGSRWQHVTNRIVVLESSHLLMLHEFERVALQKLALQKLNSSDLGVTTRIPKDSSDKTKSRAYLLKKKVLPRWDSSRDKSRESSGQPGPGPVFGVPLGQCVDVPSARKRSTCAALLTGNENIPGNNQLTDSDLLSPVTKASRSDSRASFGSVADPPDLMRHRSQDKMMMAGSTESLFDIRRQSLGHFSALDTLSVDELAELSLSGTISSPCVPTVVMMCIRHLEQFGLHTVGIFRVSSSKKRVKQLREEFDRGGQITLSMETGVHDVATLLKEFFRDLPEPVLPKEVQSALLATQKHCRNIQDQISHLQHIIQLLPLINRDTLYVLLQFLGLVAENAEDKIDESGNTVLGNKMDSLNLATLFAPNLMHSFNDDPTKGSQMTSASERMDHVSALKLLIERRDLVFQVPSVELNDAYVYLNEHFPDVLDALLRRRSALAGIEIPEDFPEEELPEDVVSIKRRPSRVATSPKETEDDLNNPISAAAPMTGVGWPVTGFKNRLDRGSGRRKSQQAEQAAAVGGKSGGYVPEVEPTRGSGLRFHVPVRPPVRKTSNTDQPHIIQRQSTSVIHMTREAIVYSPASSTFSMTSVSSTRGTPCSDMFFASGNTTPSLVASPPPTQTHFVSPPFSPPTSPPPLTSVAPVPTTTVTVSRSQLPEEPTEKMKPIKLKPVPITNERLAARLGKPMPGSEESKKSGGTENVFNTYLSVSGQRLVNNKSKTDDLERYIAEIEASDEAKDSASSNLPSVGGAGPSSASVHRKTRRRYTDSRHPTSELPDVTSSSTGAINETTNTVEKPANHRRRTQQFLAS